MLDIVCSREYVPFSDVYTTLLVSSLYRKLAFLFLIYTILTFDKKKRKKKELSGKKELSVVLSEVRSKREKLSVAGSGKPAIVHVLHFLVQHFLLLLFALS